MSLHFQGEHYGHVEFNTWKVIFWLNRSLKFWMRLFFFLLQIGKHCLFQENMDDLINYLFSLNFMVSFWKQLMLSPKVEEQHFLLSSALLWAITLCYDCSYSDYLKYVSSNIYGFKFGTLLVFQEWSLSKLDGMCWDWSCQHPPATLGLFSYCGSSEMALVHGRFQKQIKDCQ